MPGPRPSVPGLPADTMAVAGARVRLDPDADALLLQFEINDRRPEGDATALTSWFAIPRGLLPDVLQLISQSADATRPAPGH
ncbi:hypothetical protein GCM10023144_03020 [Pigmentiphaga soli]|uniref:DUF2470 domain-containing protein n=1 Tax=Pigmentiphaga soli TaxID=1007095 RepID=A0ABP8GE74_9BURK